MVADARHREREQERYRVTPGRAAGAAAALGAGVYGAKVGSAYRVKGAAKYLNAERLAAAGAKDYRRTADARSMVTHAALRPTANRWQKTFKGQARIKAAGGVPKRQRDLWLRPGKSRSAYDKDILQRGIANAPVHEGKLYRGVAVRAGQEHAPVPHKDISAWTSSGRSAGSYAQQASTYSEMPGMWRKMRNVGEGANRARVLTHEGGSRAFNITPFASKYNSPLMRMMPKEARPDEYLKGPGIYKSLSGLGELSRAGAARRRSF